MFFEPDDEDDVDSQTSDGNDDSDILRSQSYFAQQKLEMLDEKIQNKDRALRAMKDSRKPDDAKVTFINLYLHVYVFEKMHTVNLDIFAWG